MTEWRECLEVAIKQTGVKRYRYLCLEHPDSRLRLEWQRKVCEIAGILPDTSIRPPVYRQAGTLARALWDWATSGFVMASEEEQAQRMAICRACDRWDGSRCRLCGCYLAAKVRMQTEHCPIAKW